jgi:hypothetical protein
MPTNPPANDWIPALHAKEWIKTAVSENKRVDGNDASNRRPDG